MEPIKIIRKNTIACPYESPNRGKKIAKKNSRIKKIREDNISTYQQLVSEKKDLGYYDENL